MHLECIRRLPSGFTNLCEDRETILDNICVMIDDNVATIADIVVTQWIVRRFRFIPVFKKEQTDRNQGYGANLLSAPKTRAQSSML
jgi:hypothetical protein